MVDTGIASPERGGYTVGCVSYVNAIPLVMRFEEAGEKSPVRVRYDVPSRLPALLQSGEAQAILVSSVDALMVPDRRMVAHVCIGSHGPVKSVRLFSQVHPRHIQTLALDASSLTSNRLAQIILAERYGSHPTLTTMAPNLESMLAAADACVLIGDIGMAADGTGLHVLDLGEEWFKLTRKPFVWAAWIGNEGLTSELATYLIGGAALQYVGRHLDQEGVRARISRFLQPRWYGELDASIEHYAEPVRQRLIDRATRHAHWDPEVVRDYYTNVMVYDMSDQVLSGLREFQRLLLAHGFHDCAHFPQIIDTLPDLLTNLGEM